MIVCITHLLGSRHRKAESSVLSPGGSESAAETDRQNLDGINEINAVTKGIPGTTEAREEVTLGCLRRLLRGTSG